MNSTTTPYDSLPYDGAAESTIVIRPTTGFSNLDLAAVWQFRELLYFLTWRDVKVRYKQTLIGAAWVVLQPLLTTVIFTIIFGHFAKIPSDGMPYSVFTYAALLPWSYFSQAITRSGSSLVSDTNLIKKVYFPRLIIPLSAVVSPLVDFSISFLVLLGMIAWFRIPVSWPLLTVPLFLLLAILTALAVGLWLSALNARYRDVGHTIPFLIQFWMFASPVAYPLSVIPEKWRLIYGLNPMAGVIEGFRWALLNTERPGFRVMAISTAVVLLLLVGGTIFFKRMERNLADVV